MNGNKKESAGINENVKQVESVKEYVETTLGITVYKTNFAGRITYSFDDENEKRIDVAVYYPAAHPSGHSNLLVFLETEVSCAREENIEEGC